MSFYVHIEDVVWAAILRYIDTKNIVTIDCNEKTFILHSDAPELYKNIAKRFNIKYDGAFWNNNDYTLGYLIRYVAREFDND